MINNNFDYRVACQTMWNQTVRGCSQTYKRLLPGISVIGRCCLSGGKTVAACIWAHRDLVVGGAIVAIALVIIRHVKKNTPQYPTVSFESTLNTAQLRIQAPEMEHKPINVTMTFCVDVSDSMGTDERGGAVKRALNAVLQDAQKVVSRSLGSKITIAITSFNEKACVIVPITTLTCKGNQISKIQNKVQQLKSSGMTDIIKGLELAAEVVEKAAKTHVLAAHTLILLTDGEDADLQKLGSFHDRLASASVKLFAIGIGKDHKKKVLATIAKQGTYIDTTAGRHTIESAVAEIYRLAIPSFHSFRLTTAQLASHTWSVVNLQCVNGQYDLGDLSEGEVLSKVVKIYGNKLTTSLNLSTVQFVLSFIDPNGMKGELVLPWNPTTIIEPRILMAT